MRRLYVILCVVAYLTIYLVAATRDIWWLSVPVVIFCVVISELVSREVACKLGKLEGCPHFDGIDKKPLIGSSPAYILKEATSRECLEKAIEDKFVDDRENNDELEKSSFVFSASELWIEKKIDYLWYIIDENREVCAIRAEDDVPLRVIGSNISEAVAAELLKTNTIEPLSKFAEQHRAEAIIIRALSPSIQRDGKYLLAYAKEGDGVAWSLCETPSTAEEFAYRVIAGDSRALSLLRTGTKVSLAWAMARAETHQGLHPALWLSFREAIHQEGYRGYSLKHPNPMVTPLRDWAKDVVARLSVDDPLSQLAADIIRLYPSRVDRSMDDPFDRLQQDALVQDALFYPYYLNDKQAADLLGVINRRKVMLHAATSSESKGGDAATVTKEPTPDVS